MNRAILAAALLLTFCVHFPAGAGSAGPADDALSAFFRNYLEEVFRQQPVQASRLGDHRFDDELEDISPEARAGWLAHARGTLRELPRTVDRDKLSADGKIDFDMLRQDLLREIWLTENTKPFAEDPRTYGQYITDSIYVLLTQSTLPRETNVAHCLARMRKIPAVIEVAMTTLTRPPRPILETAILQNRGAIAFYESELFTLAGESQHLPQLKVAAAPIVTTLKKYEIFLEGELMRRATDHWRLGPEKFARKLDLVLDSGLSAEQVLGLAIAEYERVRNELYVISRQLWSHYFPKQVLPPDDEKGRHRTIQEVITAVNQEHGRPEELLADARATVGQIRTFIRDRDFLKLPEPDRCRVEEMPEFRRGNSVAYLDNAPPLDPQAESFYAISPPPADWKPERVKTLLEEYNRHMLQILTIHEAYPGHYVQLEYANRNPSVIRKVLSSSVYVEGWAVYTEQTMLDQGFGQGSLQLRLMQLKFYLRAVVNAILDHKMHAANMTDEEAMRLLVDGAFQSEGEARLKIIRAKQSSTQLSTYFVGRMAFYRLRQAVQRELGDQFNLGRFHEAVLEQGSIPVKYLPEQVRERLARTR